METAASKQSVALLGIQKTNGGAVANVNRHFRKRNVVGSDRQIRISECRAIVVPVHDGRLSK